MPALSDEAVVVRGGENLPASFIRGSGTLLDSNGLLSGVSVNAGDGLSILDLTQANSRKGYPGILNGRVGVTTAGAVRALGGTVEPTPTRNNPCHAALGGLTPEQASALFTPTIANPNRNRSGS